MKGKIVGMMTALAMFVAGFAVQAATLTWQGPDGGVWSEPANWTDDSGANAVPQDGDRLVIPSRTEPITLENDIANLTLARIAFTGTGASVTLTGKAYALDNPKYWGQTTGSAANLAEWPFLTETCVVTNTPAVVFKNSRTADTSKHVGIYSGKDLTFLADVSYDLPYTVYTEGASSAVMKFIGRLVAPEATLFGRQKISVYFLAPCHVKKIWYPTPSSTSWDVYFQATGCVFEDWQLGPFGSFIMAAENAVPTDAVIRWNYTNPGNSSGYGIRANTTVDRVEAPELPMSNGAFDDKKYVINGNSGTLTMRSSKSIVCYAKFSGWFNVAWDPIGDYTCEFRDRESDLKGGYTLSVLSGRAILAGKTVFKNGPLVIGENAILDVTATNGIAMPSATTVTMDFGSRLYLTNDTVQAFTADKPTLTINDGAYIEVGDKAVAPSFAKVTAYGVPVPAGSYTGADGVEGATKVPWLRGSAIVTVANSQSTMTTYWKEPVDGDWNDATKWTQGVPDSSHPASVTAQGANYTVTLANAVTQQSNWMLGNSSLHTSTLTIKAAVKTSGERNLTLGNGARFDVQTDGSYQMGGSSAILAIQPGAELRVSGGTCLLTNKVVKNMSFAGTNARTATVSVTSGSLITYRDDKPFRVGDYAHLNVSGGEVVMDNNVGWGAPYERISVAPSGRVDFSGTGELKISRSYTGAPFGSGVTTFSDDAVFVAENQEKADDYSSGQNWGVRAENPGETAVLTFADRALHERVSNSAATFYVGGTETSRATCRAIANFNSTARHGSQMKGVAANEPMITYKAMIGCGNGYGELNVTAGLVPFGQYGTRIGSVANVNAKMTDTGDSFGCTGVCCVAGGVLYSHGNRGWDPVPVPCGMLIGWGWPTTSTMERPYNGLMEVTAGVVTNINCSTVIGMGKGYGEWRQKGGMTILDSEGVKIGLAGGIGLLSVSGGTFTSMYDTYVGGAAVGTFNKGASLEAVDYPVHSHNGVGTLTVSGGRFEVKGYSNSKLYVGADGDGTVEMDGPNGTFVVPQLVLAAGIVEPGTEYATQTKATLRFKLDASGNVAPVKVNSSLSISANSKLVIDATACPEDLVGRIKLLEAGSVTGTFAPENVTILGAPKVAGKMSVSWRGTTLSLQRGAQGLLMIVR